MENKSVNSAYITLIDHQLITCSAESFVKSSESKGGSVEFITTMEFPDTSTHIKKGESYSIFVGLECIGKVGDTDTVAFRVLCKMEGFCTILNAPEAGIKSSNIFWFIPANQLYPLLSQFTSDIVSRMGYKNINIPPSVPNFTDKNITKPVARPRKKATKPS